MCHTDRDLNRYRLGEPIAGFSCAKFYCSCVFSLINFGILLSVLLFFVYVFSYRPNVICALSLRRPFNLGSVHETLNVLRKLLIGNLHHSEAAIM